MDANTELCPWCGSRITHAKFVEIQSRIREQEQEKLAQAEAELRKQLEEKHAREVEAQRRATEKAAKEEAAKLVARAASEKNQALEKLRLAQVRESTFAKQVKEEAEKRKQLEQKFQQELTAAKEAAEKRAQEEAELQRQKELNEQRQILERAKNQELLKKQAEFNREREAMQKKILEMDRQLQKKTANEMGDGAEIDLFEVLRETFQQDQITRTPKGQPGADILQEVIYKGETCGRIIIDSKNRQAWQYTFVSKLRQDQTEAKADHAILSSTVFPSGKKELCIESDVIVVHPARAVHIVELLRNAMILMHVRGLSMKERAGKMGQLYRFITSEGYSQRFNESTKLTGDILELDVQEKKAHDNVWRKRGALATRLNTVLRELDTEIAAIVEAGVGNEVPAA